MRVRDHVVAWLNQVSTGVHVEQQDQKLCVAAARYMAHRLGIDDNAVRPIAIPEENPRTPPDRRIDLRARVGWTKVAFEHTQVESYDNQIHNRHQITTFVMQVRNALPQPLPAGYFTLSMATGALSGLNTQRLGRLANDLGGMIDESARILVEREQPGVVLDIEVADQPVRLSYLPGPAEGQLDISPVAPDNLEDRRLARIERAFADKGPKLVQWGNRGHLTCLVLENRDISLANPTLTFEAARTALEGFENSPDWIVVTESTAKLWWSIMERRSWTGLEVSGFHRIDT